MAVESFSYRDQVELDVARGRLHLSGSEISRVAVPAQALDELMRAAGDESARRFGRALGQAAGARVRQRLGDQVEAASIETMVEQLGGELAVHGLGSLGVERWARALVLTVHEPVWGEGADAALAELLAACLHEVFGQDDLESVALARMGEQARFAVLSKSGASNVRAWLDSGASWGVIVERLHGAQE